MRQTKVTRTEAMNSYPELKKLGWKIEGDLVYKVCGRCLGSGNYSFNPIDGTVCYGCSGKKGQWVSAAKEEKRAKSRANYAKNKAKLAAKKKAAKELVASEFSALYPGLKEALNLDHKILADLKHNLYKWGNLTDKQIKLAFKLADQVKNPKCPYCHHDAHDDRVCHCGCGKKVEVTEGRRQLEGTILSAKYHSNKWGDQLKMLVKLNNGEKVYGSVPSLEMDNGEIFYHEDGELLIGCQVRFVATVERSQTDVYFGFFKRPKKGYLVAKKA